MARVSNRWLAASALAAMAVMMVVAGHTATSRMTARAAGLASLTVDPPSQTVQTDAGPLPLIVGVADVTHMASFELKLQYDPRVLTYVSAEIDTMLISAVGEPYCPAPIVDEEHGFVTVGCATFRAGAGVDGSGKLATITFTPNKPGISPLVFAKASFSDSYAEDVPVTPNQAVIRVLGPGETKPSTLESTPTFNAQLLTPTPPPGATVPETLSQTDPGLAGTDVQPTPPAAAGTDGSGGSTVVGGSSGGARASGSGVQATQSDDGFPIAGQGVRESKPEWPARAVVLTWIGGITCLLAGLWVRRMTTGRIAGS